MNSVGAHGHGVRAILERQYNLPYRAENKRKDLQKHGIPSSKRSHIPSVWTHLLHPGMPSHYLKENRYHQKFTFYVITKLKSCTLEETRKEYDNWRYNAWFMIWALFFYKQWHMKNVQLLFIRHVLPLNHAPNLMFGDIEELIVVWVNKKIILSCLLVSPLDMLPIRIQWWIASSSIYETKRDLNGLFTWVPLLKKSFKV